MLFFQEKYIWLNVKKSHMEIRIRKEKAVKVSRNVSRTCFSLCIQKQKTMILSTLQNPVSWLRLTRSVFQS
jgi:hypothetical protein